MTKKILSIIAAMLMILCFTACSQEEQSDKVYELDGVGIDDLVTLEIPEGYEEGDVTQNGVGSDAEIISQSWVNDDSAIWISILSYNGKKVMGMDGSLEDYVEDGQTDDVVKVSSMEKDAYITYADGTSDDDKSIKNNTIGAVFSYDAYVLSLDMENTKEQSITKDQKETFYNVLKSIEFRELEKDKQVEKISGNKVYMDDLIEFTLPDAFAASAAEEKTADENGDIADAFWTSENETLAVSVGEAEVEDVETLAKDNMNGEVKTYGDNEVYVEELSDKFLKHYRSVVVIHKGKYIQIDWESDDELTDESVKTFEEILTNMKLL